ncbi:hypothetical protein SXCC_04692 [Gluconacetobacter sp. SXCC-1]|nr:hypothetical protein SXCC_04692 [Gluconacetobacter sp. SXCC-1]
MGHYAARFLHGVHDRHIGPARVLLNPLGRHTTKKPHAAPCAHASGSVHEARCKFNRCFWRGFF